SLPWTTFEDRNLKRLLAALRPWETSDPLLLRFALQHRRKLGDLLAHDLAGLELHCRSRRDDEAAARLVRVAANPGFGEFDFQNAEVSEFHSVTLREGVGDVIERPLDDVEDLVLR